MEKISSGIRSLDSLIDSFYIGDNVVWEVEAGTNYDLFIHSFIRQSFADDLGLIYISFNRSPQSIFNNIRALVKSDRFILIDCFTSGKGKNDSTFLKFYENAPDANVIRAENPRDIENFNSLLNSVENSVQSGIRYIFDSLTGMQDLWGNEDDTYKFFTYICPRLFDMGTVAYWILEKDAHSQKFKANLRHITQVVFDLYKRRDKLFIKALKLEGRQDREAFKPHLYEVNEKDIKITLPKKERYTEIGSAVKELRTKVGISQKELADKVGLTSSFISQLENNQISPSLSSFLQICEALRISPSQLLETKKPNPIPWLISSKKLLSAEPVIMNGIKAYTIINNEEVSAKMVLFSPNALVQGHFSEQKGSELIHVIEGNLLVTLKGRTEKLIEGDSVYLKDSFPSQWKNEGGETAKVIAIS
jgi:transcriptional regulator with XRE-family HTH domain